jgi:hypothetical protein
MRYRAAGRTTVQEVPLQMHGKKFKVLLAASASVLVLGTGAASAAAAARTHHQAASAQVTPADEQYGPGTQGGGGGDVLGEQSGGGTGGLPFTGLNLLLVLGAGSGLIASGLGLRAASYRLRRN